MLDTGGLQQKLESQRQRAAVQAKEIAGLFTGVKIHSGENTITMEFEPQGRKEGLLITLATLLILVVCLVIDHFKKINVPAWIQYCAVFVWLQLLNAVVVAMFLIPVIAAVPAFRTRLY